MPSAACTEGSAAVAAVWDTLFFVSDSVVAAMAPCSSALKAAFKNSPFSHVRIELVAHSTSFWGRGDCTDHW